MYRQLILTLLLWSRLGSTSELFSYNEAIDVATQQGAVASYSHFQKCRGYEYAEISCSSRSSRIGSGARFQ